MHKSRGHFILQWPWMLISHHGMSQTKLVKIPTNRSKRGTRIAIIALAKTTEPNSKSRGTRDTVCKMRSGGHMLSSLVIQIGRSDGLAPSRIKRSNMTMAIPMMKPCLLGVTSRQVPVTIQSFMVSAISLIIGTQHKQTC